MTALNEAKQFIELGYNDFTSVTSMKGLMIQGLPGDELKDEFAEFYEYGLPLVINELRFAHHENRVLSGEDLKTLDSLEKIAKQQLDSRNAPAFVHHKH